MEIAILWRFVQINEKKKMDAIFLWTLIYQGPPVDFR